LVLDFDGVVVESNDIKHRAMAELFKGYPEKLDEIMAYHLSHNAVNRHEKFRYIMEKIMGRKYDQDLAKKWAEEFSRLTREAIINCPFVAGAKEFINYFGSRYPLYLASATPQDELFLILEGRGLNGTFTGVYGAPQPKMEIFKDIIAKEGLKSAEMLFIGDSPEDEQVARKFGCGFIALSASSGYQDMNKVKEHLLSLA
jgi:phosphoglycolate phosphatase-like HAD superfamily hydrolase